MAGKQKGSSSRSLSSDNDPILRDSNISDKIDALSNKFDSKFDELDSKFSSLHNEFSSSNVRMQACETQGTALAADLNAVKADTGLTDPLFRANMANMLATTQRLTIERYNTIYYYDQPERAENSKCRVLRLAVGGTLPTDLPTLSNLLCCAPSLITQATPQRPNSQGKARLLVQFKDQAAATAAAASFQASPNRTRAVLDLKRTFLQNARVGLAIQLQRVAREAGHEQATFRAEDGLGWDFIVYKESVAAAPKAYPYIHHFPGGQPPAQGSPFNSVDTAIVTELLKRLHPLHSFPKPLVKPPTTVPPPATTASCQPPNNTPPNHAPPPAAPPALQAFSQRPPPPHRDQPLSTSRGLFQSLPSSRNHTPRKVPPPFQGQHKRQAVSNTPPNASPSAHSSPTHRSPPRTSNTNPPPAHLRHQPPPHRPHLNFAQATGQSLNGQA